jgi:hypothetical protein
MDPVQQVLAQQQSGSAEGQGFAQFAVEGMRLGQQQQQLNLANRRLKMEEEQHQQRSMLVPLQQQMMGAQVANLGIQVETAKLQQLALTQQNAAMPELLSLQLRFSQSPDGYMDQQGLQDFTRLMMKYPIAFAGGVGADIRDNITAAPKIKMGMERIMQMNKQLAGSGMAVGGMDPKTGMPNDFIKVDQNLPAPVKEGQHLAQLRQQIANEPDPARKQQLEMELEEIRNASAGSNETMTITDADGKKITIARGRGAAAPGDTTTTTLSKAQQGLAEAQGAIAELNTLEQTLRPEDVGVAGVVGEQIFDIYLPQLGFDTADVKRMDNRTKIQSLAQGLMRDVSDDERFTENDRKFIQEMLVKPTMGESYPKAMSKLTTIKSIIAKRALIQAKQTGASNPTWAINAIVPSDFEHAFLGGLLDDEGLLKARDLGKLTKEQALQLYRKKPRGELDPATIPPAAR